MIESNLIITEEKNIKEASLFIKNAKLNIESYEYKILSEENIENLIKFQVIYDGENRILKYDVSNTISFEEYLKTKKMTQEDICNVLFSIDEILNSVENYLISENSILLDLRTIRVKKISNNKVKYEFMALPNHSADFSYELSKFLIKILRHIDVEDKNALSLAYGLFVRSSKDNYTMNDLMELVDKVADENGIGIDYTIEDLINYDEEMAKQISEEMIEENKENLLDEEIAIDDVNEVVDEEIVMDTETKSILGENILNDFDKNDKKIVKFSKKPKKTKKALNRHFNLGVVGYAIAPVIVLVAPIVYFFVLN